MKDELLRNLKKVLFDDFGYKPEMTYKPSIVMSLCAYYSSNGMPEEVETEITKLSSQLVTLKTLDSLLNALEKGRSNDFSWNPRLDREEMPAQLTLSPTFSIQRSDESSLIAEIEKIRSELKQETVKIASLIAYIGKRARESGDLNIEKGEPNAAPNA